MKTVLTIAGSDCSGGAGVQADIKTITAHKLYAESVITALTAQNTMQVFEVLPVPPEFVGRQLDAVFTDIYPDAVKIGMVLSAEIIEVIAERLDYYGASSIILDPVMIATSGNKLLNDYAREQLISKLLPKVQLITPNLQEAESLSQISIISSEAMVKAAKKINTFYKGAVLIKGGHLKACADDLLYIKEEAFWFRSARIGSSDRHGTGCTLSSAIACQLAKGCTLQDAVELAKNYIRGALADEIHLGNGCSPLNHAYSL